MPFDKMNRNWNQQSIPLENQLFQPHVSQYGQGPYTPMLNQNFQRFPLKMGGQGRSQMPFAPKQLGPDFAYPSQGIGKQQIQMQPMPYTQSYPYQGVPSQGYPLQGNVSPGYNQGYNPGNNQGYIPGYSGQMPVQPAWEEPKKGGIKGFISNLIAKRKM